MAVNYYGVSSPPYEATIQESSPMVKRASNTGAPLTPRERQVADEIMAGQTNKEIAKSLGVSYETVKEHVQHILIKYGVDRRELVAIRLMKEKLTGESLGKDFVKQFDQVA